MKDSSYGDNSTVARLPDTTPLDFFAWGFLKQEVCCTVVAALQDLSSQLDEAIVKLKDGLSLRATVHRFSY